MKFCLVPLPNEGCGESESSKKVVVDRGHFGLSVSQWVPFFSAVETLPWRLMSDYSLFSLKLQNRPGQGT